MSQQGAYQDALAAWHYLLTEQGNQAQEVILFGRSLGGAVATWLATQVDEKALIIESTFSSVPDMANWMIPYVSRLFYYRYEFNTEAMIREIGSPLLLMHSQDDEIVPYALAEKVFAAAQSPKYYFELEGDHNTGFLQNIPGYLQAINWFITLDE